MTWTTDVPYEPGFYWMYGWVGSRIHQKPELKQVYVFEDSVGHTCFTIDGKHAYRGWLEYRTIWCPITTPHMDPTIFYQFLGHSSIVQASDYYGGSYETQ
jgi:hypothetical protein